MAVDNKKAPCVQALLDRDFVPMTMAAGMAYFDITAQRNVAGSAAQLVEMGRLVAIALSTVAPIYRMAEGGQQALAMTAEEINERLFKARSARLDDLAIKRQDLAKAIATLKEARTTFGDP